MIDGLRAMFTGEELRTSIDARIARHRAAAAHWARECERTAEDETEESPLLPGHMCRNESAREAWHADVLTVLRKRIESSETYRLNMADLERAGLLPAKPELIGPEEFEALANQNGDLGPYAERICDSPEIVLITNPHAMARRKTSDGS